MVIYRDYTTFDVMLGQPCIIDNCGAFYPIKVKDYYMFYKRYNRYFTYTKKHLDRALPNIEGVPLSTLQKTMIFNSRILQTPDDFGNALEPQEALLEVIKDLEKAFSIVTKEEITLDKTGAFINESGTVNINDKNFDFVLKVVALQNLIYQPNYYEDPEYERVIEKARIAHNPNPISFEEMVAYVKNLGKITYQEVMEENVLQLHCDYSCLQKEEDYRTAMNFRLVADKKTSQQLAKEKLTSKFIDSLYDNSDSYLLTDLGKLGFVND